MNRRRVAKADRISNVKKMVSMHAPSSSSSWHPRQTEYVDQPMPTEAAEGVDADSRSQKQDYPHPKQSAYRDPRRRPQPPFSFSSDRYSVQIPGPGPAAEDLADRGWQQQQRGRA